MFTPSPDVHETTHAPIPIAPRSLNPETRIPIPPASDRELLTLWINHQHTLSLEALIRRHAPLVHLLTQKLLRSPHEQADAFQTVFLLLSQNAVKILKRESLASWIYGVTVRTCLMLSRTRRLHTPPPMTSLPRRIPIWPRSNNRNSPRP